MDKFSFITLWDAYSGLLTATQQEITDMYFNLDLTASEIAAEKNVSRQAVSDCLKSCKRQLEEYEEKLHFCKRMQEVTKKVGLWANDLKAAHPELDKEADKLLGIIK